MAAEPVDIERLGERLKRVRTQRGVTLQDVARQTRISIATLSRVERGGSKDVESSTLLALSNWLGTSPEEFVDPIPVPPLPPHTRNVPQATPDIVELYLRADKNLDRSTAVALAKMFRAAYEQLSKQKLKR